MIPKLAAIVLAAGRGSRFGGSPKLIAPLRGEPLVRHAVTSALSGGASPVLVVLGHREAEIREALRDLPIGFVLNAAYAEGLASSLKAGFAALPNGTDGVFVLLGDMPEITPDLLEAIAGAWTKAGRPDAAIPTWEGRRGNPVLLSAKLAPDIEELQGDGGAAQFLRGRANVLEVPVGSPGVTIDIDTQEALEAAVRQARTSTTPSRIAE